MLLNSSQDNYPYREVTKSLKDVGRDHLRFCVQLTVGVPFSEVDLALVAKAVRVLSIADLRRASSSDDDAMEILYATLESDPNESSMVARFVFDQSIVMAATEAGLGGSLVPLAARRVAQDLDQVICTGLSAGDYQLVIDTATILDAVGNMLGEAFYQVSSLYYLLLADSQSRSGWPSGIDGLFSETGREEMRREMRQSLWTARQQCQGDQMRMATLARFEDVLGC